jgi:uncharacterized protein (DUF697 family)
MTRKPLPKVIRRSDADLRVVGVEPDVEAPISHRAALHTHSQIEPEILPPLLKDSLPVAPSASLVEAERRLRDALKVVERHQLYAGFGGLFPIAPVNVASVTAIILRMTKLLSDLYGVPFEREKTRTVIIGLMGGATPTGLAAATASLFVHVIPAAGAIGIAVSSVTAAALTRKIGLYFVERFENSAVG